MTKIIPVNCPNDGLAMVVRAEKFAEVEAVRVPGNNVAAVKKLWFCPTCKHEEWRSAA